MKRRVGLGLLLTLSLAAPAGAQEWYEHYLAARDRHIPAGQYVAATRALRAAIRLKPSSKADEQTYGLQFVDYFPYYYLGLCQLRTGEARVALVSFDAEDRQGAIRARPQLRKDLQLRRQEAQTEVERGEQQRLLRLTQERVEGQIARAGELERERRFDLALEILTQAQSTAEALDPQTQRRVQELLVHIRGIKHDADEATARTNRLDKALADARRFLEEGREQEAVLKFDEVLALDPRNASAEAGRREAQDRILAATTRQQREQAFQRGRELFQAGQYAEALPLLSQAASDPSNSAAQELLARTQQLVEGLRHQREVRRTVERLMAEGEALLTARRFAAAQVKFQQVLDLDPTNVRAREREAHAASRSEEAAFDKLRPNRPPSLVILEPTSAQLETDSDTVVVEFVATDDRGLARIEFYVGGQRVAEQEVPRRLDSREPQREQLFQRPFTLTAGLNEIRVRVVDVAGLAQETTFSVSRRLRYYERPAFRPIVVTSALALVALGLVLGRWRRSRALRRRFNPYVAGAPIANDDLYFGRQQLLTRVLNLLHHNSFMITGERRIGKTSFLLRLKRALEAEEGSPFKFFPVLIDLQGVSEDGFFPALASDIVDALAPSPETRVRMRYSPDRPRYEGRDFSHDLQLLLAELATRTQLKVKLVLLMDEIDVLNQYSERTNQLLRSIFMKTFSEHLVTVMCGVGVKRAWSSDASPWYNFFEQIKLTPFLRADAEALIRTPVASVFRYDPQAVESILEYSQMKPYLLQRFGIHVVNRILDANRTTITALDVEGVRTQVFAAEEDAGDPDAVQSASA